MLNFVANLLKSQIDIEESKVKGCVILIFYHLKM